ncbi:hypothetical protein CACET_c26910 [Clostridium aceticum]|uniref:Uncharacterized protein n=1 Tax=Clostridium aceticum TaxID=84022 RepID=A0A0D8I963_9CLOT|nr:hypothetical protein [Clostridium aceticum]AKL96136.1 hypothetical protein CACET_c26910 [Clostridium aceticum]KJF26562.1 hypothetical protein TZ02_11835 [Clostridium aceticum]
MFYDTEVKILKDSTRDSVEKTIYADVQPYLRHYSFEDGYDIYITKRMFCEKEESITMDTYLLIEDKKYKVMEIKKWQDYLEVWLYESRRD